MEKIAFVHGIKPEAAPLAAWRRHAVCWAVATTREGKGATVDSVAREFYGKAAVTPTTMSATALTPTDVGVYLKSLRPKSAAARLFDRAMSVSLAGVGQVSLPRTGTFSGFAWVAEGAPIPVLQGTIAAATLGPMKKLAAITTLTNELANMGRGQAETTIRTVMDEAAANALDASVFSTAAASAERPAGLLNGATTTTGTAGGGVTALVADLKWLAGGISDAGGGLGMMIFANPRQAISLAAQIGTNVDVEVVPTPALAAGTVVAIETGAIAFALDDLPKIDISRETVVHMDDAPLQIGTPGAPPTVAAPTRSVWQTDSTALRLILRTTWATRAPGLIQVITNTTW